jgi:glycosyltransferase involved in cell wall biosynthesis
MNICEMIDNFYNMGAQKVVLDFAREATAHGDRLIAIALEEDPTHFIRDELEKLGVKTYILPAQRLYDPSRLLKIVQILKSQQIELIQSHLTWSNLLGPLVGRLSQIPVAATLHSTRIKQDYHPQAQLATLDWAANGVIAVSQAIADMYQPNLHHKKIEVISNAVGAIPRLPVEEREQIRRQCLGDPDKTMLISVGRLEEPKGYPDLIAAFAQIAQSFPQAILLIAGSGSLQAALQVQIDAGGLSKQVILLGERHDIPKILASSDLYVSSSHWEGLSIAVLEAMSAGLPVVATRIGGNVEILDGRGTLVPPGSPDLLAQAVIQLLAAPARMKDLGSQALEYVNREHNLERWYIRLVTYFSTLIRRT